MGTLQKWNVLFYGIAPVMLFCASSPAALEFNDGGVHDINSPVGGVVIVRNSFWDEPTTVNILPDAAMSQLYAYDESQVSVLGGRITSVLLPRDRSRIVITDGRIESVWATNQSHIEMYGGTIAGQLSAVDDVSGVIVGGTIDHLSTGNNAVINVHGGQIDNAASSDGGTIILGGGMITNDLIVLDHGHISIQSTRIDGFIDIRLDANVVIIGEDFVLDQHPVSGEIVNPFDIVNYGHLTGQYLNGTPIDLNLKMQPETSVTLTSEPGTTPPKCKSFPVMDFDKDCKVGFSDLAIFMDHWLDCNLEPASACLE